MLKSTSCTGCCLSTWATTLLISILKDKKIGRILCQWGFESVSGHCLSNLMYNSHLPFFLGTAGFENSLSYIFMVKQSLCLGSVMVEVC